MNAFRCKQTSYMNALNNSTKHLLSSGFGIDFNRKLLYFRLSFGDELSLYQ